MTLNADRNTKARMGDCQESAVTGGVRIHGGALLVRDVNGYLKPGATETGLVGVGRAEEAVDNTGGADGAESVKWCPGRFRYGNSAGADALDLSHIGGPCYVVDDETVAATDGGGTRSVAGAVEDVTADGVWVRFDEALARVL